MSIFPPRLQAGDEIRVIAPARSMAAMADKLRDRACALLAERFGFKVTFGAHVTKDPDVMGSSPLEGRLADLHDAFADESVKGVLCAFGGFNANHLLPYLDYDLIKSNPKMLCGYSDITVLVNAIYAKTGVETYHGPNFINFAMKDGLNYTLDQFEKALMSPDAFDVIAPEQWSDDKWYRDQDARDFIKNDGYWVLREGEASGVALGGSLCSLQLLHGTAYMPDLRGSIVFAEMDAYTDGGDAVEFDRDLVSLTQQPGFDGVRGLVIGRFQKRSEMSREKLSYILTSKKELEGLPILANVDFGHTTPNITIPIGRHVAVCTHRNDSQLSFAHM